MNLVDATPHRAGLWFALILLGVAVTACGGGGGEAEEELEEPGTVIGPAGGTVDGPNGARVVIPPGALATETRINIEQTTAGAPPLPNGVTPFGPMFAFTPHGTTFSVPVTMTVPFDAALVPAGATPTLYKTNAAMSAFDVVPGSSVAAGSVTAQVTSFSLDFVGPIPPPPLETTDHPRRSWQFRAFRSDAFNFVALSPLRIRSEGPVEGDEAMHVYGEKLFQFPRPDNTAIGQVFSTANGRTYSVLAEGMRGSIGDPDTFVGSFVDFEHRQSYRHTTDGPGSIVMKITAVNLDGFDANPSDIISFECRVRPECQLEMFASIDVHVRVQESGGHPLFFATGKAVLRNISSAAQPSADKWDLDVKNQGPNLLWREGNLTLEGPRDTHGHVGLNGPITLNIVVPRPVVPQDVTLIVSVQAKTFNQVQGESYVMAYFRDPVQAGGATIETTGLVPTNDPSLEPPGETDPAPVCTTGVDPGAGVLQFSVPEYATLELPQAQQSIVVTRTGGTSGAVSARFTTSDGTAIAGTDYEPVTTTVFFGDDDAEPRSIEIPLVLDTAAESDKAVNLRLSDVRGCAALGAQDTAVLTILDNDRPLPPSAFSVGGSVTGLVGNGLVLSHLTTGENLPVSSNGPFTFTQRLANDIDFNVTVGTQPADPAQICTVTNGTGTVANADVTNVAVQCATPPPNGSLDSGFGDGGRVTTGLAGGATALSLQGDGKLLTVGGLRLARHNPDGSLDATFGSGGQVTVRFTGAATDAAQDVAVQPDGKIVVVGFTRVGSNDDFAVARFNTDGSVDTGFGSNGFASVDFAGAVDRAWSVLIQTDGRIVVAGHAGVSSPLGLDNDFAAARFTSAGVLDQSFGTAGTVRTNIAGRTDLAVAAALQADGRIVLAGRVANTGGDNADFGLVRYDSDGTLDTSFAAGGILRADMNGGGWDEATDVAIQSDGKIAVAGLAAVPAGFRFAVARFELDGARDNGFGTNGFVTTALSTDDDFGRGIALQADGRIVIVGQSSNPSQPDFGVVRYDTDGTLDPSFGAAGILSIDFFGAADGAEDVVVQPDGKIVVAGFARNGTSTGLGLVRINP